MSQDQKIAAIVLAGGKSKRMKSNLSKVLHQLNGRAIIHYPLDLLDRLGISERVVVVGHQASEVQREIGSRAKTAYQEQQLGTAHAFGVGLKELDKEIQDVLVMNADDSAFYQTETIRSFLNHHLKLRPVLSFISLVKEDPTALGRVVKDRNGKLTAIVEEKGATDEVKQIKEINSGCYCFQKEWAQRNLKKIKLSPAGEYYITDFVELALKEGERVEVFKIENEREWVGINTPEELEKAKQEFQRRDEC